MMNRLRALLIFGVVTVPLAACGDNNNTTPPPAPAPPMVAKVETQFGTCFAARYQASPFSKATDPVPCPDLPAVSATTKAAPI